MPTASLVQREGHGREALGKLFNLAAQFMVVPGIKDTQCGAKAARAEIWADILQNCTEAGFAWDVEIVAVARSLDYAVQEIGVEWSHDELSRVHVGRDGIAMALALPRIRRRAKEVKRMRESGRAGMDGVFSDENIALLAEADTSHWWFRNKAAYVSAALRREGFPPGPLVDLGSGSGGVTAMLGWPPEETVVVDGSPDLIRLATARHALEGVVADLSDVPLPDGHAAVVCLLDVIEHLPDPRAALREARRLLKPGGRLVVTVPAHPTLWSAADVALGHVKRYTRPDLRGLLVSEGFVVRSLSHIFSWLALPVWLKRKVLHRRDVELGLDVTSPLLDRLSLVLTRTENVALRRVSMPVGTSLLCVATPGSPPKELGMLAGEPEDPAPVPQRPSREQLPIRHGRMGMHGLGVRDVPAFPARFRGSVGEVDVLAVEADSPRRSRRARPASRGAGTGRRRGASLPAPAPSAARPGRSGPAACRRASA